VGRVLGDPASPRGQLVAAELLAAAWGTIAAPDPLLPTLKQIGRALREKHLQIWSARPADGPLLDSLGWDGSLDVNDVTGDHLQVALTNLVAEAVDPRVEIAYDVTVTASGDARATCRVTVTNDSSRLYRGLVALYAPRGAALSAADPADGPPAHREGPGMVFLRTLRVPAGKAGTVRFDYSSPQVAREPTIGLPPTDTRPVYRITIQRQASSHPAEVTVRVTLPPGSTIRTAEGWEVEGSVASLRLTLTRDLVRQIEF
jgi:hypothetical protein